MSAVVDRARHGTDHPNESSRPGARRGRRCGGESGDEHGRRVDAGVLHLRRHPHRRAFDDLTVAGLRRPEGVAVLGDAVFVADTGNDRILRVNLESGESEELELRGLQ